MKQITLVFLALLVAILSTSVYAEMTKEGSGSYRGAKAGTVNIITFEKGHIQVNFDEAGVIVEAPENSPFFNATFHAIGTYTAKQGAAEGSGGIKFTRPNGDTIYGTFNFGGIHQEGPKSGVIKILGGTGECAGIEGEMELGPRPNKQNSTGPGRYQNFAIGNMTWKLP